VSQADIANRYGLYLDYLHRAGQLEMTQGAASLVSPAHVAGFIAELQARDNLRVGFHMAQSVRTADGARCVSGHDADVRHVPCYRADCSDRAVVPCEEVKNRMIGVAISHILLRRSIVKHEYVGVQRQRITRYLQEKA
jgi:hypothetical protein